MDMFTKFNRKRIDDRDIDTLIGLCKGLAADNRINLDEAKCLSAWLVQCKSRSFNPLVENLLEKVEDVLSDGVIDNDESIELVSTLNGIAGVSSEVGELAQATSLPLCDPAPPFSFKGRNFLYTGTFAYGARKLCQQATKERGGLNASSVTRKLDFLVIGTYVTDSWKHESFGTKIMKAAEYRDRGIPISIISEQHWIKIGEIT